MAFQVSVTHWFLLTPFCHQATVVTPGRRGRGQSRKPEAERESGKGCYERITIGNSNLHPSLPLDQSFIYLSISLFGGGDGK